MSTKGKYHINSKGEVGICRAEKRGCRFSDNGHFDTEEQASEAAAAKEGLNEMPQTSSKKSDRIENKSQKNDQATKNQFVSNGIDFSPFNLDKSTPQEYDGFMADKYEELDRIAWQKRREEDWVIARSYLNFKKDVPRIEQLKASIAKLQENGPDEHVEKFIELQKAYNRKSDEIDALDSRFNERGGWNRAFLTNNDGGHVHKTTDDCGSLNRNMRRTSMSWMTDYSGKSEDEIVEAAGYRACTRCYPSAPVGDERTLPTKMFSEKEKKTMEERQKRAEELAKKKSDARSKAPTASGEPLVVKIRGRKEELKTERTATILYSDTMFDQTSHKIMYPHLKDDSDSLQSKEARRVIIESLAEKRGISPKEMQSELDEKVKKKVEKSNKDWVSKERDKLRKDAEFFKYDPPSWIDVDEPYVFEPDDFGF